jgi:hypothetical protein
MKKLNAALYLAITVVLCLFITGCNAKLSDEDVDRIADRVAEKMNDEFTDDFKDLIKQYEDVVTTTQPTTTTQNTDTTPEVVNPTNAIIFDMNAYTSFRLPSDIVDENNKRAKEVYTAMQSLITKMQVSGASYGPFDEDKLYGVILSSSRGGSDVESLDFVTYEQFGDRISAFLSFSKESEDDCYAVFEMGRSNVTQVYYGSLKDDIYYGSYPDQRVQATFDTLEDLGDIAWIN